MLDLKRYVPRGRVSTGLLGTFNGQLVWALNREAYWRREPDGTLVGLIGVGGGQEPGETLTQAVAREALEETRSRISISSAPVTVWVHANGRAETVDLSPELGGDTAPVLIWQDRQLYLAYELDYICSVYRAEFLDRPSPGAETPGLMLVGLGSFRSLLDAPRSLKDLLAEGAEYTGAKLPDDALLSLQGSARYLARHWDLVRSHVTL